MTKQKKQELLNEFSEVVNDLLWVKFGNDLIANNPLVDNGNTIHKNIKIILNSKKLLKQNKVVKYSNFNLKGLEFTINSVYQSKNKIIIEYDCFVDSKTFYQTFKTTTNG